MAERPCVISEVVFKDRNVPPIIGLFENGNLKLRAGGVRKCGIFRKKSGDGKYIVAVHTSDNALYMGTEPPEEPYRNLLAIQNKGSHKVRLIEVDKVQLKAKSVVEFISNTDDGNTISDLYKAFGSKVIKRKTEQKERMSVKVEAFANRLQDTAASISADNSLNIIEDDEYHGTYIPCNRDAININHVYNARDIISDNELQELHEEALGVLANSEEDNSENYSKFFNENLKQIPENNKVYCVKLLLYAECLVQFLSVSPKEKSKKDFIICPFSEAINAKIFEDFTERGRERRVSPSLKDKALCHAIVAGLLACGFTLHVGSLNHLTRTPVDKFFTLCRVLGAVPLSKDEKNIIVLRVPLPVVSGPRLVKKKKQYR